VSEALEDGQELLLRQVHGSFVREGRPSSQAFRPTKKDDKKLSVSRGALVTAAQAFELHTVGKKLTSAGTWAVTVGECSVEGLPSYADPIVATETEVADSAHAIVDFSGVTSNGQLEAKATRLARIASARGRLHPAEAEDGGARSD